MACRIVNLHSQPLRVDLRGGEFLLLAPGGRSRALRDEALYDNQHLVEWERAGWLRRIPARMSEVLADAATASAAVAPAAAKPGKRGGGKSAPAPAASRGAGKAAPKTSAAKPPTRKTAKR